MWSRLHRPDVREVERGKYILAWELWTEQLLWKIRIRLCAQLRSVILQLKWQRCANAFRLEHSVSQFWREYEECMLKRLITYKLRFGR